MKIQFATNNAAFKSDFDDDALDSIYLKEESIRILNKIIADIKNECTSGAIIDINGHKIGRWSL